MSSEQLTLVICCIEGDYRDYFIGHELRIPIDQSGFNGTSFQGFERCSDGVMGGSEKRWW